MKNGDLEKGYTSSECEKEAGREERPSTYNKGISPYSPFDMDDSDDNIGEGFVQRNNTQDRL
jgi:hypothetical protein